MSRKDLSLKKYDISGARYRELFYFCRQYTEWKQELSVIATVKPQKLSGMPSGRNGKSDPTADAAAKCAELTAKCELIEQTAIETSSELYQYILKNVTQGVPYEYMDIPCCRQKFYNTRRKFFYNLSKKR